MRRTRFSTSRNSTRRQLACCKTDTCLWRHELVERAACSCALRVYRPKNCVDHRSIAPATSCHAPQCTPKDLVAARNKIQGSLVNESRLGIPASWSQEALHSGAAGGTVFPELVTQGSTWDPQLIKNISAAVAAEARMTGVDVAFSPVLNQWVDSRFGRLQEGYSENPTLTAAYAVAAVQGFQGPQPPGKWAPMALDKVVALGKHYAAYGAALGGLNGAPAELSERTLREFFLKSWRAFAHAGGKGAMTAHNTVLGQPCHANDYLVNTIFREEFGFGDGIIVSDCNDIEALVDFRVAEDIPHAAAAAMEGGVDLDLQCGSNSAYTQLQEAISARILNETKVEVAARRVLLEKFAAGLFDHPLTDPVRQTIVHPWLCATNFKKCCLEPSRSLDPQLLCAGHQALVDGLNNPVHQALALKAAEEGTVLLINRPHGSSQEPLLPLPQMLKTIAVVGPNGGCDSAEPPDTELCGASYNMLGSYTQYQPNPTGKYPVEVPTVFDALKKQFPHSKVGMSTPVTYASVPLSQYCRN